MKKCIFILFIDATLAGGGACGNRAYPAYHPIANINFPTPGEEQKGISPTPSARGNPEKELYPMSWVGGFVQGRYTSVKLKSMGNEIDFIDSFEKTFTVICKATLLIFHILLSSGDISVESNKPSAILDELSISLTMFWGRHLRVKEAQ